MVDTMPAFFSTVHGVACVIVHPTVFYLLKYLFLDMFVPQLRFIKWLALIYL